MAADVAPVIVDAQPVIVHHRRQHAPGRLFLQEAALAVAAGQGDAHLHQLRGGGPQARRRVFGIVVPAVGGILLLRQPAAEGGVGGELFIQGLIIAGALETQGLGDLLLEGLPQGRAGDALEGELRQGDPAAGVHVLLSAGLDPAELRRVAPSAQHVLQGQRLVVRPVTGEAVNVIACRMAEQGGEGQGALFDEFRHDAGNVRVRVDEPLVRVPQQRQGKHRL